MDDSKNPYDLREIKKQIFKKLQLSGPELTASSSAKGAFIKAIEEETRAFQEGFKREMEARRAALEYEMARNVYTASTDPTPTTFSGGLIPTSLVAAGAAPGLVYTGSTGTSSGATQISWTPPPRTLESIQAEIDAHRAKLAALEAEHAALKAERDWADEVLKAAATPEPPGGWDDDHGGPKVTVQEKRVDTSRVPDIIRCDRHPSLEVYIIKFKDGFKVAVPLETVKQAQRNGNDLKSLRDYVVGKWAEAHPEAAEETYGLSEAV